MTRTRMCCNVALATVTMLGAFQLRTANAANTSDFADCNSYAIGYATGYCAGQGLRLGSAVWTCATPKSLPDMQGITCY